MCTLFLIALGGLLLGSVLTWLWLRFRWQHWVSAHLQQLQREYPTLTPLQRAPFAEDPVVALFERLTETLHVVQRELERSQARQAQLAALFDHLSDGVVLIDSEGVVVSINRAACSLLVGASGNPVGRSYVTVLRDYELNELVAQTLAYREPRGRFVELGRQQRVVQAEASLLPGSEQPLLTLVLRDITELRRTELIRRDFVANVSHDLRTPLAALQALVETLLDGALADRTVAEDFLRRIATEVEHLTRLVNQLLELSKAESGQLQLACVPTNLVDLVETTLRRFEPRATARQITLELRRPEQFPLVPCDPERVSQVLVNLLDNALKFTPEQGRVTVELATEGEMAVVRVRDTGPGIPAEELERVFERFFKGDRARHSAGSGLGLAIVKHLVQLHAGRVWAESPPEGGAVVGFTLPLTRDKIVTTPSQG